MKLIDYLSKKQILFTDADTREDLFRFIAQSLYNQKVVSGKAIAEEIEKDLSEREKLSSTGLGNGIAIPHIISNSFSSTMIFFCKTKKLLDFNSLDRKPVNLFFFIFGKSSCISEHLHILSRIAFFCKDKNFLKLLDMQSKKSEIWEIIKNKDMSTP